MTTLSLLTPSGRLTLGNLLGALRPMAERQADAFYGISDLHAMTTPHDPTELRERTRELMTLLLAAGLDRSTLFRQSAVPAHTALAYLLECTAHTGELNRMIQFKEKGRGVATTRCSLFTYPVLMAADILLYRPAEVPVGADQRQHVELTRDLAIRFNATYGAVFTVPSIVTPASGARVMDLAEPTRKMSKSVSGPGSILLLDPPDVVRRKVARAVTDSDTGPDAVRPDRDAKPGVTNLLDVLDRVRRRRRRPHDVRRAQGGRHRRGGRGPRTAPGPLRRPRRRPGPRGGGLRLRLPALPRGHRPRPHRRPLRHGPLTLPLSCH